MTRTHVYNLSDVELAEQATDILRERKLLSPTTSALVFDYADAGYLMTIDQISVTHYKVINRWRASYDQGPLAWSTEGHIQAVFRAFVRQHRGNFINRRTP